MRVWHLAWEFPPLVHGGLGRYVDALTSAQRRLGTDVGVLTCRDDVTGGTAPAPPRHETSRLSATGTLEVVRVGLGRGWSDVVTDADAWQDAVVAVGEPHVAGSDVLHAHDWMVADAARRLSRSSGVPWVLTVHATEHGRRHGRLDEPVHRAVHEAERRAATSADRVVVCSKAMQAEVTQVLGADPASVTVVPAGVDPAAWQPGPTQLERAHRRWGDASGPLVVAAGRLEWEKGFSTLLRTLPTLLAAHPAARLVLAGAGSYRAELEALLDELGVASGPGRRVELPGRLEQADLAGLLAVADVVVVPSRYEPFGLVALEAMAAGTCVVVTATGGLAETVEDDVTGRVVPVGDVDELATTLVGLLGDDRWRRRLANAGRAAALGRDWDAVAARVGDVYASLRPSVS